MDTLYIGDIPSDFHYARFGTDYIDLYNTDTLLPNQSYDYYRVYLYNNLFMYESYNTITSSYYNTQHLNEINVSSNPMYRQDMPNIVIVTFIFALFGVWLFNIISSFINKGGVLGGLL